MELFTFVTHFFYLLIYHNFTPSFIIVINFVKMSAETEVTEAPNWLKELEAKRERRLKVKLGHEAGAGAPCLVCNEKCPGLDLHFWRKICKVCKCSKENHDVHDDDIYSWAQFELLGSKPNKIRRKIVLPGKKDEVELDWTPKGQNDTVEKYLKTLPTSQLPVKGSQAALDRKQLLQKQIPIHDIDPSLCHELTAGELKEMNEYIAHVKEKSAGVGQIISLAQLIKLNNNALPRVVPQENVVYGKPAGVVRDLTYGSYATSEGLPQVGQVAGSLEKLKLGDFTPHYGSGGFQLYEDSQKPVDVPRNFKDLVYSTYEDKKGGYDGLLAYSPNNNQEGSVGGFEDSQFNNNNSKMDKEKKLSEVYPVKLPNLPQGDNLEPYQVTIGPINDLVYNPTEQPLELPHSYPKKVPKDSIIEPESSKCHHCKKPLLDEFAISIERSSALYHAACFKCHGCNQSLADNFYFYDVESDQIYCGRDYAKIRGIPRCNACDELIFTKEYCLAQDATFHLKHFCCYHCDKPLAGQNYVLEEQVPFCLPCYEENKADKCVGCMAVIKPNEQGMVLNGLHFHVSEVCFACVVCKMALFQKKMLLRGGKLYCSHECFGTV